MKNICAKYELLRTCFSKKLEQTKEQILYRTHVLQNSRFCAKLPLTACETFHFSTFVCIWCLILRARIQSLKESRVVAMESFSIELIEAIVHKCFKKVAFKILKELKKNTHTKNTISGKGVIWLICPQIWHQTQKLRMKAVHLKTCTSYVHFLHVQFTFVFFWDEVRSKKI